MDRKVRRDRAWLRAGGRSGDEERVRERMGREWKRRAEGEKGNGEKRGGEQEERVDDEEGRAETCALDETDNNERNGDGSGGEADTGGRS